MPINMNDGTFGLDCWTDANPINEEADQILYSENVAELKAEAIRLIKGGRFQLCELYRYDYANQEWELIDEFTSEDLD